MNISRNTLLIIFGAFSLIRCSNTDVTPVNQSAIEAPKLNDDLPTPSISKPLTLEIINKTKDEYLVQVIMDNLFELIGEDYKETYKIVSGLTSGQKAIYSIWWVEAEVNNGGFNQYYFNSSGQFSEMAYNGCILINAPIFAELMKKANQTFEDENEKITESLDGTVEGFSESYENNPLNDYDTEYYNLHKKENYYQLQIDYIRNHPEQFVNK